MEEKRNACRILVRKTAGKETTMKNEDVRGWIILKCILVWGCMSWIDLDRIGTSGELLLTRQRNVEFHKMMGSCRVAAQLAASQEGLSSKKLVALTLELAVLLL
jgi:hypothetical protein